jgi:hypothetical protein
MSIEAAKSKERRGKAASPCCAVSVKKEALGKKHQWRSIPRLRRTAALRLERLLREERVGAGAGCAGLEGALL